MALATFVKISGINNLSDARYCAGMEVNQIGFNIEPNHENYTAPKDFEEIANWTSGVEFVGEVESSTDIASLASQYSLQVIEVHKKEQIEAALATGLKVIFRSNNLSELNDLIQSPNGIDYFICEGNGQGLNSLDKVLITEGFEAENIKTYVEKAKIKGIALQGGNEIRPGFKDFDELADMLEALDVDEFA